MVITPSKILRLVSFYGIDFSPRPVIALHSPFVTALYRQLIQWFLGPVAIFYQQLIQRFVENWSFIVGSSWIFEFDISTVEIIRISDVFNLVSCSNEIIQHNKLMQHDKIIQHIKLIKDSKINIVNTIS